MANAGQDVQYHNTGRERAEQLGTQIHDRPDQSGEMLHRAAHHGTPSEQRDMWNQVLKTNGDGDTSQKHLPQGFSVTGDEGHRVVTEKGKVVYDEAKTGAQADRDAQIHRGEGPYQALRRQGMTHEEAMKAARDVKDTDKIGDNGFKQGQSVKQDADGKGGWHQYDQARAEQKGLAAVDAENKRLDDEKKTFTDTLKDNQSFSIMHMQRELTLDAINARLAPDGSGGVLYDYQKKALEGMRDNFKELAGGGTAITQATLDAYYAKKHQENFV